MSPAAVPDRSGGLTTSCVVVDLGVDRGGVVSERRATGLSAEVIGDLIAELGPVWQARQEARLRAHR